MSNNISIILFLIGIQILLPSQTEGYVQSDGVKIYFRSFGEGAPVLIINGGPGMNSNGFEVPAKRLSKHFRSIIYDQRGTGKSSVHQRNSDNITMDLMVEDMEQLRKHLKIERWSILGHSFGGMLASYYATIHPDRITSLILSSSGGIDLGLITYVRKSIDGRLSDQELDSVRYWEGRIEVGDTSYHARYRRGISLAPAYLVNKANVPLLADRLTQSDLLINRLMWENMQKIRFDCAPLLERFTQPVLIIQGKQDIISDETAQHARSVFKNSTLALLDNCGHYGWLDREQEYFDIIEHFLRGK